MGCARYLYVAGLCQIYTAHVPLGMCHGHYVIEHISWVSHVGYVSGASIYWKYPPDKKYPGIYLGGIAVDIIPGNLLLEKSPGQLNSGRMTRAIMTWGCFPGKKLLTYFVDNIRGDTRWTCFLDINPLDIGPGELILVHVG